MYEMIFGARCKKQEEEDLLVRLIQKFRLGTKTKRNKDAINFDKHSKLYNVDVNFAIMLRELCIWRSKLDI